MTIEDNINEIEIVYDNYSVLPFQKNNGKIKIKTIPSLFLTIIMISFVLYFANGLIMKIPFMEIVCLCVTLIFSVLYVNDYEARINEHVNFMTRWYAVNGKDKRPNKYNARDLFKQDIKLKYKDNKQRVLDIIDNIQHYLNKPNLNTFVYLITFLTVVFSGFVINIASGYAMFNPDNKKEFQLDYIWVTNFIAWTGASFYLIWIIDTIRRFKYFKRKNLLHWLNETILEWNHLTTVSSGQN